MRGPRAWLADILARVLPPQKTPQMSEWNDLYNCCDFTPTLCKARVWNAFKHKLSKVAISLPSSICKCAAGFALLLQSLLFRGRPFCFTFQGSLIIHQRETITARKDWLLYTGDTLGDFSCSFWVQYKENLIICNSLQCHHTGHWLCEVFMMGDEIDL